MNGSSINVLWSKKLCVCLKLIHHYGNLTKIWVHVCMKLIHRGVVTKIWVHNPLQRVQICSDEETNSSTFWMAWGSANLNLWLNYLFSASHSKQCCKHSNIVIVYLQRDTRTWFIFKWSRVFRVYFVNL